MATKKKKSPRNNVVAVRTLKKWQHHLVLVSLVLSLSKACMCAESRVYSGNYIPRYVTHAHNYGLPLDLVISEG